MDLGESVPLSSVKLFEINGSVKNFTIDVSGDNSTWETVYTGTSIGDGLNMKFSPTYGRYVRLNVTEASAKPVAISEFEVRFNSSDSECVAADTEALVIQSAYKLTANLTLPQSGIFGSGIIWSSSNTGLVSNSGVILERPAKDTVIIMKAKIQTSLKNMNIQMEHKMHKHFLLG